MFFVLLVTVSAAVHATPDPRRRFRDQDLPAQYWTAYLNVSYVDTARQVWHTEKTETGRFGTAGPTSAGTVGAGGVAVSLRSAADPEDDSVCAPPFVQDSIPSDQPWVALVRRGGCTFKEKIAHATALNASAVLVYDDEERDTLESMSTDGEETPAVLTYHWKGREIIDLMKTIGRVYVTLQKGAQCFAVANDRPPVICSRPTGGNAVLNLYESPSPYSPNWPWNTTSEGGSGSSTTSTSPADLAVEKRTSVLFVSISFVVLMVISLAWLVFYYVQRFRYLHAKDRLERKLCGQAKRALSIISTSVLRKDDLEMRDFSETCAVCIETYRVADVVRILPCKHQFHKSCIDQWLLEKRTCPMCKMDILKHYGLTDQEDAEEREEPLISLS